MHWSIRSPTFSQCWKCGRRLSRLGLARVCIAVLFCERWSRFRPRWAFAIDSTKPPPSPSLSAACVSTCAGAECSLAPMNLLDEEPGLATGSVLLRRPLYLGYTILGLVALTFGTDLLVDTHSSIGVVYSVPVLLTLWLGRRELTIAAALVCAALVLAAIPAHHVLEDDLHEIVLGRCSNLFAISIAAALSVMRLRSERDLQRVRSWAVTTLRGLSEAVISVDTSGHVVFVNNAAERMLARPREQLLRRPLGDVFIVRDVDAPVRPPVVELAELGIGDAREGKLFVFGGRRIDIEYSRSAILSASEERFGEVIVFRDIRSRKEDEEAIRKLAYRDDLTGLPNRVSLLDRFQLELAHARRGKQVLGVMYFDLDGFKRVNDTYGHEAGDYVLQTTARRLASTLRAGDTVARLGGDEFVLLLPAVAGPDEARKVGEKLVAAVGQPIEWQGAALQVSASIGLALYPDDGDEPETLLRRADKAMYRAKTDGRAKVEAVRRSERD
ncbi:MAG: diguanylate cyclase [Planctomycetes bacterium]|nr:diguanylate cyclase [Planctomycetota bacterium]